MVIQINNYTDLLNFIKQDNISVDEACIVISKTLNILIPFEVPKAMLIKHTEYFIKTFCQNNDSWERPLFLSQKV